ncbi:hypothetical protein [Marinospirillum sp.]|uniref:hypothetical protein n=1 Tax=Marinospirillum sp. TaxID=2183934 RepID=UPI0025B851F4|nr:hypothetical protein [Marinospirillum sp.]
MQMAEAIQEFWDENFEPSVDQYERLRSIFTADEEGIDRRLAELGSKFEVALPILPTSKSVAYAMRGYEIHRKDRRSSIEQMLQRDFRGAVISWLPLYAVIGEPYGTRFLTEIEMGELGIDPSEAYMTSRGKTLVNSPVAKESGFSSDSIRAALDRKLLEIKPAHIVYDGIQFISIYIGEIEPVIITHPLNIAAGRHWLDANPVDSVVSIISSVSVNTVDVGGEMLSLQWRLDMGWDINGVFRPRPGLEGDVIGIISNLASDSASHQLVEVLPTLDLTRALKSVTRQYTDVEDQDISGASVATVRHPLLNLEQPDDMPRMDDIPADFAPLDMYYE